MAAVNHIAMRQGPPSAPAWSSVNRIEDSKCTLPSISNLLNLADGATTTSPSSPVEKRAHPGTSSSSESVKRTKTQVPFTASPSSRRNYLEVSQYSKVASRPTSSYAAPPSRGLPPTPPLSSAASADGHSPRDEHFHHFPPPPRSGSYFHETTPPLEHDPRRQRPVSPPPHAQHHQYQQPRQSHHSPPRHAEALAPPPPPAGPLHQPHYSQSFPPPPAPRPQEYGSNPWQHHHYLNPAHGAGYQQNPERYICPTCSKAFSRPSSLRIHSHSHTGEKPYKCAHAGCGKAFSVRSNMKRHERGCHSFEVTSGTRFVV